MASKPISRNAPKPGPARPTSAPKKPFDRSRAPTDIAPEAGVPLGPTHPFGPDFFKTQLGVFVRDRCPEPSAGLPAVELHLVGGDVLNVCHVAGLAPNWVALTVDDRDTAGTASMRTEVVAYEQIARITIHSLRPNGDRVGFTIGAVPSST